MLEIGLTPVEAGTDLFMMERPPPLGLGELIVAGSLWPPCGLLASLGSEPLLLDLAVMVISGLGEGSRDMLALALLAAARTSAMELLKVRGIAPEDSELLKSCEFELLRGTGSCGLVWSVEVVEAGALEAGGVSLSSLARLGVGMEEGVTGVTVRAARR